MFVKKVVAPRLKSELRRTYSCGSLEGEFFVNNPKVFRIDFHHLGDTRLWNARTIALGFIAVWIFWVPLLCSISILLPFLNRLVAGQICSFANFVFFKPIWGYEKPNSQVADSPSISQGNPPPYLKYHRLSRGYTDLPEVKHPWGTMVFL